MNFSLRNQGSNLTKWKKNVNGFFLWFLCLHQTDLKKMSYKNLSVFFGQTHICRHGNLWHLNTKFQSVQYLSLNESLHWIWRNSLNVFPFLLRKNGTDDGRTTWKPNASSYVCCLRGGVRIQVLHSQPKPVSWGNVCDKLLHISALEKNCKLK